MITLGVFALGACERREATAPRQQAARFSHRLTADISGEYRPIGGGAPVASLFIGQEKAFADWEAGKANAPPVILSLAGPEGEARVTVQTYAVTDADLRITGAKADGGAVRMTARIDEGALSTARRNLGDQTAVITGMVSVDGRQSPIRLGWWGGD